MDNYSKNESINIMLKHMSERMAEIGSDVSETKNKVNEVSVKVAETSIKVEQLNTWVTNINTRMETWNQGGCPNGRRVEERVNSLEKNCDEIEERFETFRRDTSVVGGSSGAAAGSVMTLIMTWLTKLFT